MSGAPDFLRGTVRVRATGAQVERLLNEASGRGIHLGNVRRNGRRELLFAVAYAGFFALRPVLRSTKTRVKILKKEGLPYFRSRLGARLGFAAGAVLCLLLVLGLSQIVWDVRIIGDVNDFRLDVAEEVLREHGAAPGALRGEIRPREISEAILARTGDLTFAGARMRGMVLEVELVEAEPAPEIFDRDAPVDIVASRDGVVESIRALEGRAVVAPGQRVRRGDVLIRGRAIGPGGEMDVHARGEAVLRVWVSEQGAAPLYRERAEATGRYVNRRFIMMGGVRLPEAPDQVFEGQRAVRRDTPILPGLFWPITFRLETVYEMDIAREPRPAEEAQREAEQSAILTALTKLPKSAVVVDKWVEFSKMKDTTVCARVHLEVLRECGQERAR